MQTTKKDHSKDEYYLAYALVDLEHRYDDDPKEECPLDNNRIKDGYIECKSTGRGYDNSDNMKFKSCSLHSIVDGDDIVNYSHGYVGYDFNPDSINVFAGSWQDLHTDNNANKLINNDKFLNLKKLGSLYVGKGGVDEIMNKKYKNRAKLIKKVAKIDNKIFKDNNLNDDDSFDSKNYRVEKFNETEMCVKSSDEAWNEAVDIENCFYEKDKTYLKTNDLKKKFESFSKEDLSELPIGILCNFRLFYNNETGKVYDQSANELLCTAKDPKKGVKVDRIFVLESKLQKLQDEQKVGGDYKEIYDRYINKLTDVLIQQFPFGEIRVVQGSIEEGQKNVFLSPEEFIKTYFVNEKDKQHYLQELDKIRKSKTYQYGQKEPYKNYNPKQPSNKKSYQVENAKYCGNGF